MVRRTPYYIKLLFRTHNVDYVADSALNASFKYILRNKKRMEHIKTHKTPRKKDRETELKKRRFVF